MRKLLGGFFWGIFIVSTIIGLFFNFWIALGIAGFSLLINVLMNLNSTMSRRDEHLKKARVFEEDFRSAYEDPYDERLEKVRALEKLQEELKQTISREERKVKELEKVKLMKDIYQEFEEDNNSETWN